VIGEFNNWNLDNNYQMKQTLDTSRFWIQLDNLNKGQEYAYQYVVDGALKIADPFTQKILDPSNDQFIDSNTYPDLKLYPVGKTTGNVSILQTAQVPYNWKYNLSSPPAKTDLVIYELLVRDFTQKHSYKGVIDSLAYLKNLGINAIELMPVMEFEGNISWGYNPSFYFAPDKYYGTSDNLKQLIDTCHSLGIAIILDIVLNHSFGQSPMVQLYWDSKNGRPAANSPWFNPIPKHDYNVGYDFNHESPYTKKFVSQVLKFWLTQYKTDGFRFDLSKGFTQKNTLGNVAAWGNYDATRVAILEKIADTVWSVNNNAYVILEHFADNSEEKVLDAYGMMLWGNLNYNYTQASMGYLAGEDLAQGSYKARTFANPGLITYMESHDEERMVYKNLTYGNTANPNYYIKENLSLSLVRAELATAFFFTIPGPKMVWQFGELGYDYSINYNSDRTGPKPIRWDYYSNPNRYRLYSVYKELIGLKKNLAAFRSTDFTLDVGDSLKIIAINDPSMDVRVIGNFSVNKQKIDASFSKIGKWYDYFSGDSLDVTNIHQLIDLGISEYRIYTSVRLKKHDIITAPEAHNVTITGTIQTGSVLTANYDYFDLNGDLEGTSLFKWYNGPSINGNNKAEIVGATSKQYTLTEGDHWKYVFFEVTPIAQSGTLLEGIPQFASVDFAVGINKLNTQDILVFPNPFIDGLTIKISDFSIKNATIEISNIMGQVLLKRTIIPGNKLLLNNLYKGIYVLSVYSGNEIWRKNIVKIK
jgi:glycosidase